MIISRLESWCAERDDGKRREIVERLIDDMVGYDRWGRPIQGFPDYWYMDFGTPNDDEARRAATVLDALADEAGEDEPGVDLVSALPSRLHGDRGEAQRADPLQVRGGFDPKRAIALLRAWREGTPEEIAEQRAAGDAILESLEREPVRFREVRLEG